MSDRAKVRRLWVLYRLTPEEVDKIDRFQMSHPVYKVLMRPPLGTDHCHTSGKIRGRLYWLLNRVYGSLEKAYPDNLPEVLRALAVYHENPPAEIALGEQRYGLIGQAKRKKKMIYGSPDGPLKPEKKTRRRRNA